MNGSPGLDIRNVSIDFGSTRAVDDASFAVPAGSLSVIVGPSGCGKTSLLRAVAGFIRPRRGTIRISGRTVSSGADFVEPEERHVGMVFQDGALFPHLNVRRNVEFGIRDLPRRDERVRELLRLLELDGLGERFPDQLSGGQQQRVALARALAPEPGIVLLDEPFASLDSQLRRRVRSQIVSALRARSVTALLVTHDRDEALEVADRLIVMLDGRIAQVDDPREIYERPADRRTALLIGDGWLVSCDGEPGSVETPFGRLSLEGAAARNRLRLLVRPEQLRLGGSGAAGAAGIVERLCFLGTRTVARVRIDFEPGSIELPLAGGDELPEIGETVRVALTPGRYCLYTEEGDRRDGTVG